MLYLLTLEKHLILLSLQNCGQFLGGGGGGETQKKKNGLKGKMYLAITSMYNVVKSNIRSGNDITESFMCPRGLNQG